MTNYSGQGSSIVWDHKSPLWSQRFDRSFNDLEDIFDYCDDSYNFDDELKEKWDACRESNQLICEFLELYLCNV